MLPTCDTFSPLVSRFHAAQTILTPNFETPDSIASFPSRRPDQFSLLQKKNSIFMLTLPKVVDGTTRTVPYSPVFMLPICWGTQYAETILKDGFKNTVDRWLVNYSNGVCALSWDFPTLLSSLYSCCLQPVSSKACLIFWYTTHREWEREREHHE